MGNGRTVGNGKRPKNRQKVKGKKKRKKETTNLPRDCKSLGSRVYEAYWSESKQV